MKVMSSSVSEAAYIYVFLFLQAVGSCANNPGWGASQVPRRGCRHCESSIITWDKCFFG